MGSSGRAWIYCIPRLLPRRVSSHVPNAETGYQYLLSIQIKGQRDLLDYLIRQRCPSRNLNPSTSIQTLDSNPRPSRSIVPEKLLSSHIQRLCYIIAQSASMIRRHLINRMKSILYSSGSERVHRVLESRHYLLRQVFGIRHVRLVAGLPRRHDCRACGDDDGACDMEEVAQPFAEAGSVEGADADGVEGAFVFHGFVVLVFACWLAFGDLKDY